jgi:enoyl-CoA hydratase
MTMPDTEPGSDGLVRIDTDGGVATLTLNDPARRNCVSAEMSLALAAACRQVAADRQAHAVVLTGSGSVFSSGGNAAAMGDRTEPLSVLYRGFEAVATMAVPTIAAVNGPAVGAGMNFALACDVIVAAESARFDPRFLDVGIHPGGGHLWRLQARAGRQAAAALILFGESLTGDEAVAHGLAWACVPDADLLLKAHSMASRAAGRSPELVRRTKSTLNASVPITNAREASDLEEVVQEWSMTRPAFREGVAALQRALADRNR